MENTPNLTKGYSEILEHQIRTTRPGQAHFANTGPFGTTCGECAFLGYFKTTRGFRADGTVKTKHVRACAKFRELTGKHGAVLQVDTPSCRYFVRREEEK
jgi:hypothetical protein